MPVIVSGSAGETVISGSGVLVSGSTGGNDMGVPSDKTLVQLASGSVTFNIGDQAGDDFKIINAGATSVLHVEGDTQRVGIGNTAPASQLHIGNASATVKQVATIQNDKGKTEIGVARGGADIISTAAAGDLVISNETSMKNIRFGVGTGAGTEAMIISGSKNVGIGTSTPGTMLQIEGAEAYLTLKNSTNEHTEGGAESRIIFEDHSNVPLAQIQASHDGAADDTKGDLIFSTHNGTSLTERIRISSAGYVGIGTDASLPLHVESALDYLAKFESTDSFAGIILEDNASTTDGNRLAVTGDNMRLFTAASERMRISSTGLVGIGTSNPEKLLHLHGANSTDVEIRLTERNGADNDNLGFNIGYLGSQTGNRFSIESDNGSTLTERFIIERDTGNVGIGTTEPSGTLHVMTAKAGVLAHAGAKDFVLESDDTMGMSLLGGASNSARIYFGSSGGNRDGKIDYNLNDDKMQFGTADATRMVIDNAGNVGIGATDPGKLLDVRGATPYTRITDTTDGSWDFGDILGGLEFYSEDTNGPSGAGPAVVSYVRAAHLRAGSGHSYSDAGLEFGTTDGSAVVSTKMVVANDGKVGIGTTAPSANLHVVGDLENHFATATAAGAGWTPATANTTYISKVNGEIVTTILFELDNLACSGTIDKAVIGNQGGTAGAYLTQITTAKNGIVYKAEMMCIETPAGGNNEPDIDLVTSDQNNLKQGFVYDGGGTSKLVISAGADYVAGMRKESAAGEDLSGLVGDWVYLAVGNGAGADGGYTAGKFVIKLYGADF